MNNLIASLEEKLSHLIESKKEFVVFDSSLLGYEFGSSIAKTEVGYDFTIYSGDEPPFTVMASVSIDGVRFFQPTNISIRLTKVFGEAIVLFDTSVRYLVMSTDYDYMFGDTINYVEPNKREVSPYNSSDHVFLDSEGIRKVVYNLRQESFLTKENETHIFNVVDNYTESNHRVGVIAFNGVLKSFNFNYSKSEDDIIKEMRSGFDNADPASIRFISSTLGGSAFVKRKDRP